MFAQVVSLLGLTRRARLVVALVVGLAAVVSLGGIVCVCLRPSRPCRPAVDPALRESLAELDADSVPLSPEPPLLRKPTCRRAAVRYYIRMLRDEDPVKRQVAAKALANLGDIAALPHLIASLPFADDSLEPAFSNLRRGAKLSASFFGDDPAVLAVLEFGERGAAALPWTLSRLRGRARGLAILLAATAGLGGVSPSVVEVLKEIALSQDEEGAVPAIAVLALESMGERGADALAEIVEALEARGESEERLNSAQGEFPKLTQICLEARLRAMSTQSPDVAALCEVLGMPEEPTRQWAFRVGLLASRDAPSNERILVLLPLPEAESWRPVIVVTTRDFRPVWWKSVDELPGIGPCELKLEEDPRAICLSCIVRRRPQIEEREVRVEGW